MSSVSEHFSRPVRNRQRVVLGLYALVTVVPLLAGWMYSVAYSTGFAGVFRQGFTPQHWQRLLQAPVHGGEAWITLGYTACLTLVSMALIICLALLLSHHMVFNRAGKRLYAWLFLPLTLPPAVAAFVFFELLSPAGLLSRVSVALHLTSSVEDFPRLVNDAASVGIIATQVFLLFPFFTLVFVHQAGLENMPALRRAAHSLGAGNRDFARRIYLPLMLKRSLPVLLLYGVYLVGTYEIPLLLGRSSPRVVTIFVTEQLSRFDLNNIPLGHAMAVLYSLLVVGALAFALSRRSGQLREQ